MANRNVARAVRVALVSAGALGAGLYGAGSVAQEQLAEIVVTGSRIARTELEASIPTVSIDSGALASKGYENLADVFTSMPQFMPSFGTSRTQSTFSGVGASGLNLANLRNLGGVRTLTLINGRRIPGGTSTSTSVDFNTIPSANIERIDVQTGGAAAVYGADAVAGVVNIITKKDFEGIEIGVSYGEAGEGDNKNPSGYIMFGGGFGDGGRGLFTAQYDKQGQVSCADRDFCSDDFFWGSPDNPIFGPNARSGVPLGGRFFLPNGTSVVTRNGSITDADGNLMPFVTAIDGYNRNAQRDLAIPTERIMIAAEVEYPISERITAFGEANYGVSDIESQFEAHPYQSNRAGSLFGGGPGLAGLAANIPIDNPFLPTALRDEILLQDPTATEIVWWQRFAWFSGRGATSSRGTVRGVAGLRGDFDSIAGFGSNWNWEISHVWGQTRVDLGTEGLVSTGGLYYGLRVEPDPDVAGAYRCADAGARATGCIPINPFNYTDEMTEALRLSSVTEGTSTLNDTVAYLTGSAFDLPAGSVQLAGGLEYRTLDGYLNYDEIINQGLATGNQIQDVDKTTIRTKEIFVEALVPILSGMPFAHALDLEGAYRYSDAGDLDTYDTWKLGATWAPIDSLRFRVMQAQSVRTPVPGELSGIGQTFGVVNDPCTEARRNANPTRAANCAADGVPEDYNPGQIIEQSVAGLTGGNPDLVPEEGTTLTYGLVWTPSFIENFSLTLDRFEAKVDRAIDVVGRQDAVNFCYDQGLYCEAVTRGTNVLIPGATYILTAVNEQLQNVAEYKVNGIDLAVNYGLGMGRFGDLGFNLAMTFYDKAEKIPLPGEAIINLKGNAGGSTSDQGFIEQQANLGIRYNLGNVSAVWDIRYLGSANMAEFAPPSDGWPKIGSKNYHSLRVAYEFSEGSEVYVGGTNLFDEDPPIFCSGCAGTQALDTIPGYYDVFGRSWYVGTRLKF